RNVSNGEYLPKPQTRQQKQVEERIKELADSTSKKLGISRRKFLASSGGMAAALLAMNEVYGKFFKVDPVELVEPAAAAENGLPDDLFVVDDQLHFVRGNTTITLGAPSLRAIAQGPTSSAFGFPTNPFNPDGFRDEARAGEILTAAQTAAARNFINDIAGSRRAMAHGLLYVGTANLEYIQYQVENHRPDSWKGYCISNAAQPGRSAVSTGPARNTA